MGSRIAIRSTWGFSLVELLLVLAVVGACLAGGAVGLVGGSRNVEARGAAQCWQAAAAWAQIGVLWQGGTGELVYGHGVCALSGDRGLWGGDLGGAAPDAPVCTNLSRWAGSRTVVVTFGGSLASPDGGGSLYFGPRRAAQRVVVRPVSGLTVREREGAVR